MNKPKYHTLLVGMQNGTVTLKNSLAVSSKPTQLYTIQYL